MHRTAGRVEDNLRDPITVPQIDKHELPVVSAAGHPSHQRSGFAGVRFG